jgi:FkbM family methyltransferase
VLYISTRDLWGLGRFYFRRKYDRASVQRLGEILRSRDDFVFWDIGANYGAYTVLLGPEAARAVAIEPSQRTFDHLSRSCKPLDRQIILERCAISDRSGESLLYLCEDHSGDNRTYRPTVEGDSRKTEPVRLRTLDEVAAEHFDPLPAHHVVKIDVQGAEPRVLRGARRLIGNAETLYVFMELWPKGLKEDGSSLGELMGLCTDMGLGPVDEGLAPAEWKPIEERFKAEGDALVLDVLLAKRPG